MSTMVMLLRRLRYYCEIDDELAKPLVDIPGRLIEAPRGTDLIIAGDPVPHGFFVESGWAIRYALLPDGRRQVLNVLMPGDMFDLQILVAAEADHSVTAITDMTLKTFKADDLLDVFNRSGRLAQGLWWAAVQEEAILREQIVRNGRRNARERIAHFLLELHRRALIAAEGKEDGFRLPLTQSLIGDALGLTSIHVNRILKRFRDEALIRRSGQWIELLERDRLIELCDFDPAYLHLDAYPRRLRFKQANGK